MPEYMTHAFETPAYDPSTGRPRFRTRKSSRPYDLVPASIASGFGKFMRFGRTRGQGLAFPALKTIGKRFGAIGLGITAFDITRELEKSGKIPFSKLLSPTRIAKIGAVAVNPLFGLAGQATGIIEKQTSNIVQSGTELFGPYGPLGGYGKMTPNIPALPPFREFPQPRFPRREREPDTFGGQSIMVSPAGVNVAGPQVSVAGGGGPDLGMLALLLGGGLLGGVALGRRRRRKRSKKRKSKKRR